MKLEKVESKHFAAHSSVGCNLQ